MKKHLSLFCLMARSSFYKVILLILAMALVQILSFLQNYRNMAIENIISLGQIVDNSFISISFLIALFGIIYFLARNTYSTNIYYTYFRLNISFEWVFFWKVLYSALCFLLLWMIQICLFIGFYKYYAANMGLLIPQYQNMSTAFYMSGFMYTLCPLGNAAGFLDITLLILLFSMCCASVMTNDATKSSSGFWPFWLIWCLVTPSSSDFPPHNMFIALILSIIIVIISGIIIYQLKHSKEDKYETEDGL